MNTCSIYGDNSDYIYGIAYFKLVDDWFSMILLTVQITKSMRTLKRVEPLEFVYCWLKACHVVKRMWLHVTIWERLFRLCFPLTWSIIIPQFFVSSWYFLQAITEPTNLHYWHIIVKKPMKIKKYWAAIYPTIGLIHIAHPRSRHRRSQPVPSSLGESAQR